MPQVHPYGNGIITGRTSLALRGRGQAPHEHIIRDRHALGKIQQYIINIPYLGKQTNCTPIIPQNGRRDRPYKIIPITIRLCDPRKYHL